MIKVFRISDLIKYFIRIIIPIIILSIILQIVSNQNLAKQVESSIKQEALLNSISSTVTEIEIVENNEETQKENKKNDLIFLSELALANNLKQQGKSDTEEQDLQTETKEASEEKVVTQAKTDVTTEVIESGVNPRVTNEYNGIQINNMSDHELTEEILTPDIEINKSKVIIYHTHTCESYTPTEQYYYEASGNYRSIDLNYSVARVGDELDAQLSALGIQVVHDKTYHDHPAYNGSYSRSLITAQNCLTANPNTDIVIDLHRDAIADPNYAPKVKIGEEYASQLMFVMGGLNENWVQNLKFAIKVMQKANELYPGLFKPLILRNSEYNQHLAKGGCIIEVGATGNTLEESINSMKYLAKIINEI